MISGPWLPALGASLRDHAEAFRRQHESKCAEIGDLQSLKLPGLGQQDQR